MTEYEIRIVAIESATKKQRSKISKHDISNNKKIVNIERRDKKQLRDKFKSKIVERN